MKKILQKDSPILRQIAKPVTTEMFGSQELQTMIQEMSESLAVHNDGVALAGPQIGLPWRIFIISQKLLNEEQETQNDIPFINPEIIKLSKKKAWMDEGCLSVRNIYGQVLRSNKATITAYNQKGEKFEWNAEGLIAQIFQHETDHLDGILFIDKARDLKYIEVDGKHRPIA